jgi:hypothetical protein
LNEKYQTNYYSDQEITKRFMAKDDPDDLEKAWLASQLDDAVQSAKAAISKVSTDKAFVRAAIYKLLDSLR